MTDTYAARLLAWYDRHGRKDLPWQHPRTPYRVWISEVMLQQTQVATALPYFERFVAALPDVRTLASAALDDVLALWSGLGYYTRARNLHRAARLCVERHGGDLPAGVAELSALPGIGRSTAAAIAAQAHGARHAILDGNVRRVLSRRHGVDGDPASARTHARLWQLAESLLPHERLADYTQAQMDLGATLCRRRNPDCARCPVAEDCHAREHALQDLLPAPKRRRTSPERDVVLLLATDAEQRVLCETRPASGIWGGLVSVPEFADRDALERARAELALSALVELPPFVHVFSHFRLRAQPYAARIAAPRAIGDTTQRMVARDELDRVALPAPIRRLLLDYWNAACPAPSTAPA
jgi:A/G-specific adenine glycosylase